MLTQAEERVRTAWGAGVAAEFGAGGEDAAGGARWGAERTVRGHVLRTLLVEAAAGDLRPAELRLRGARVSGVLDLRAIELPFALVLEGVYAEATLRLNAAQAVSFGLLGCHIVVPDGFAVDASHVATRGNVDMTGTRVIGGEVELSGAQIGGNLVLDGMNVSNPDGRATVNAGQTAVGQYVICGQGFRSEGRMRLSGARITGDLDFADAELNNPTGPALYAALLHVGADLFVHEGTRVRGSFCLPGARISGIAVFGEATFRASPDCAEDGRYGLDIEGLTVEQDLAFGRRFTLVGPMRAAGAQVTGTCRVEGTLRPLPEGGDASALDLRGLRADTLVLTPRQEIVGVVDLARATVRVLEDRRAVWPRHLRLREFRYEAIDDHAADADVSARLGWLARDTDGYAPQPYEQLALAYRAAGRADDARAVAVAGQVRRRTVLGPWSRVWNRAQQWTVGYGYRPWLAGLWIAAFLLVGTAVFAWQYPHNIVPANPEETRPPFNPLLYAMDWLVPVIDFKQGKYWVPRGVAQVWACVSVAAGWVLGTAVVAALTGLVKKE